MIGRFLQEASSPPQPPSNNPCSQFYCLLSPRPLISAPFLLFTQSLAPTPPPTETRFLSSHNTCLASPPPAAPFFAGCCDPGSRSADSHGSWLPLHSAPGPLTLVLLSLPICLSRFVSGCLCHCLSISPSASSSVSFSVLLHSVSISFASGNQPSAKCGN